MSPWEFVLYVVLAYWFVFCPLLALWKWRTPNWDTPPALDPPADPWDRVTTATRRREGR